MTLPVPPLPAAGSWTGQWIEPAEPPGGPPVQRPAYHLAGEVTISGPVASAWLHATAHGIYEAFINGTRVGDDELRAILGENAAKLYGFDLDALAPLAAAHGPTVDELRRPLTELPPDANSALRRAAGERLVV